MLIFNRRFRKVCNEILAGVVSYIFHFAIYGIKIDMNIMYRHENGYFYPIIMKIFILVHLFNSNNCPVSWGNNSIFNPIDMTARNTKKPNHQKKRNQQHQGYQNINPTRQFSKIKIAK